MDDGWPCSGPLLKLAVDLAERLLPGKQNIFCYYYKRAKMFTQKQAVNSQVETEIFLKAYFGLRCLCDSKLPFNPGEWGRGYSLEFWVGIVVLDLHKPDPVLDYMWLNFDTHTALS